MTGQLVDDRGQVLAQVASSHQGMGRFAFTPAPVREYRVQLSDGQGNLTTVPVPVLKTEGCVMQSLDDFSHRLSQVRVGLWCTRDQTVVVHALLHERPLDQPADIKRARASELKGLEELARRDALRN